MPRAVRRAALLLAALLPAGASAWSEAGHRIVAAIAEARLSPEARRLVREIVGAKGLADRDVAMWADDHRDDRTRTWHYVNLPLQAERYDPARDCPRAGCAVSALEAAIQGLREGADARTLADSLRWLVHLAADLHQPMHAGEGRDRGGNDTWVRVGRRKQPISAHRLWDQEVLKPLLGRRSALEVARAIDGAIAPADAEGWAAERSPAAWAEDSHRLARRLYAELAAFPADGKYRRLPGDYAETHRAVVTEALARAGIRLAAVLNAVAAERAGRLPR